MDFNQTSRFPIDVLRMHALLHRLQNFQHVASRIELTWGTRDCREYLYKLTIDDPKQSVIRRGFPFEVLDAIVDLIQLHDEFYPTFAPVVKPWEQKI